MPAPIVTFASITGVDYAAGDIQLFARVSIHRRIYRQAVKKNREHMLTVNVSYISNVGTVENVTSGAVLVKACALVGSLPDKRREVKVAVPLNGAAMPSQNPNYNSTVTLTLQPKPGTDRDDDEGDDDAIDDATYDNT